MRSALLAVKGVTRVRVSLETAEAIVNYDSRETTVDELIKAVDNAQGPFPYTATVKLPAH